MAMQQNTQNRDDEKTNSTGKYGVGDPQREDKFQVEATGKKDDKNTAQQRDLNKSEDTADNQKTDTQRRNAA